MHLYLPTPSAHISSEFSLSLSTGSDLCEEEENDGTMRRFFCYHGPFLIIILLVAMCTARASRPLASTEQGKVEVITGGLSQVGPSSVGTEEEDAWNPVDVEDCGNGDAEECSNRRMLAEAHLDYIYTQHHKH